MEQNSNIQLNPTCIMNVPLDTYKDDFTFIVNKEEFKTNRLISDLLSPKICKIHMIDPTIDTFYINTNNQGHFSYILDLVTFSLKAVPNDELPFISEVIEILENESITNKESKQELNLTEDNIFQEIKAHEKYGRFYSNFLQQEIEFISSYFFQLCKNHEEEILELQDSTIERIITNEYLVLNDEDQLLKFINKLYKRNKTFSDLYKTVYFERVTLESISEFVDIFNINDITSASWIKISNRLKHEVKLESEKIDKNRYNIMISFNENEPFEGIINYLRKSHDGNIDKEISITSSRSHCNNVKDILKFDSKSSFWTENDENSWICIDFNKYRIIPTSYTIRSCHGPSYPKSWFIEVRNDNESWKVIDQQKDCSYLNGTFNVHTFKIKNQNLNKVKYIRIRQDSNWSNNHHLGIGAFEVYGSIFNIE